MGRQWLQKHRNLNANKRAKITTRLVREVTIAAKLGVPDPNMNARLAVAIEAARKQSVSNDVIARAIRKSQGGPAGGAELALVTFEGMSPQGVPVIVECLTDNRNRTAPDMRTLFRGGQLGAKVLFFFEHVGMIEATHPTGGLDLETVAIEAGAQEFEADDAPEGGSAAHFYTSPKDLDAATAHLRAQGWSVVQSEMGYKAKQPAALSPEDRQAHEAFLEAIDDHDDCHRIYTA